MNKLKFIFISLFFLTLLWLVVKPLSKKQMQLLKKKMHKLTQYIGKKSKNLKMDLGKPDEDFKNEKGNTELSL